MRITHQTATPVRHSVAAPFEGASRRTAGHAPAPTRPGPQRPQGTAAILRTSGTPATPTPATRGTAAQQPTHAGPGVKPSALPNVPRSTVTVPHIVGTARARHQDTISLTPRVHTAPESPAAGVAEADVPAPAPPAYQPTDFLDFLSKIMKFGELLSSGQLPQFGLDILGLGGNTAPTETPAAETPTTPEVAEPFGPHAEQRLTRALRRELRSVRGKIDDQLGMFTDKLSDAVKSGELGVTEARGLRREVHGLEQQFRADLTAAFRQMRQDPEFGPEQLMASVQSSFDGLIANLQGSVDALGSAEGADGASATGLSKFLHRMTGAFGNVTGKLTGLAEKLGMAHEQAMMDTEPMPDTTPAPSSSEPSAAYIAKALTYAQVGGKFELPSGRMLDLFS